MALRLLALAVLLGGAQAQWLNKGGKLFARPRLMPNGRRLVDAPAPAPAPPGGKAPPSGMTTGGGMPSSMSVDCPTDVNGASYAGHSAYLGKDTVMAAPLLGNVGCVDMEALARRSTTNVGGSAQVPVNIYGPMEAGFSSEQPGAGCLGNETVPGGVDTNLADAVMNKICKDNGDSDGIQVLDYCGGHANPYHYHERMNCLFSADPVTGHSTRIGTALDGNGIYGHHVDGGCEPTDLDACGGRTGVTPDSNGERVYYYVITNKAPFVLGCFGKKDHFTTATECRAAYEDYCNGDNLVDLETKHGTDQYDLYCPCYDTHGSNVAQIEGDEKVPEFLSSRGYEEFVGSHGDASTEAAEYEYYAQSSYCTTTGDTTTTTPGPNTDPTGTDGSGINGQMYCNPDGTKWDAELGQCVATLDGAIKACRRARGEKWAYTCEQSSTDAASCPSTPGDDSGKDDGSVPTGGQDSESNAEGEGRRRLLVLG